MLISTKLHVLHAHRFPVGLQVLQVLLHVRHPEVVVGLHDGFEDLLTPVCFVEGGFVDCFVEVGFVDCFVEGGFVDGGVLLQDEEEVLFFEGEQLDEDGRAELLFEDDLQHLELVLHVDGSYLQQ